LKGEEAGEGVAGEGERSKLFEVLSFSRKEQPFSSTAVSLGFPFCVYAELEA
jgi:hypothetical protein